jgi:RNA polymerase sigma factor (sigma-70 family)
MATDAALARQYAAERDAEAFRQLVERHAGMVYGTALRITGNAHDAEDVTQDCFIRLARNAGRAARAVPAWLHRTARNRSLDVVRNRGTRRRHERQAPVREAPDDLTWEDIAGHVDAALDRLPSELRAPLVAHFLEGRSQREVAADMGINQSTVSRRIEKGVSQLRTALQEAGVAAPAAVLMGVLAESGEVAAPPAVTSALGKLALAGMGRDGTATAGTAAKIATGGVAASAALLAALALVLGGEPDERAPVISAAPPPVAEPPEEEAQMSREPELPAAARTVIEGIRQVGYGHYQWCPFSACLASCMEYLGEEPPGAGNVPADTVQPDALDGLYDYILFASGSCFRLTWNAERWDLGNVGIGHMAEDMTEPFRRAFEALGYGCEIIFTATGYSADYGQEATGDEDELRARIIDSVDRDVPVIAIGVTGPPEFAIIAGYDEGGDVLIGWSFFPDEADGLEPSGYFRKGDWYANTHGIILIGEKGERPEPVETCRRGLPWALATARATRIRNHHCGAAAYRAWAEAMRDDSAFPDDVNVLFERLLTHQDAMCIVNNRERAARELRRAAEVLPEAASELLEAARCYDEANGMLGRMHEATGGYINPSDTQRLHLLTDPVARGKIADVILEAGEKEAEAVKHLAGAVAVLNEGRTGG